MWQQNMALIEEHRKQLERDAAHYRKVRELRLQQSNQNGVLDIARAQVGKSLMLISGILRKQSDTANSRLQVRKI